MYSAPVQVVVHCGFRGRGGRPADFHLELVPALQPRIALGVHRCERASAQLQLAHMQPHSSNARYGRGMHLRHSCSRRACYPCFGMQL